MEVQMFSHFTMKAVQFFRQPQRRKAHEGVRIVHLDHATRMNSKLEFRQGTNILLIVVRGVWGSMRNEGEVGEVKWGEVGRVKGGRTVGTGG